MDKINQFLDNLHASLDAFFTKYDWLFPAAFLAFLVVMLTVHPN